MSQPITTADIEAVQAHDNTSKDTPIQNEHEEDDIDLDDAKNPRPAVVGFTGKHAELYAEALEKYGVEGSIPAEAEKRLKRKIDRRILPLLGICYFFYCEWHIYCLSIH